MHARAHEFKAAAKKITKTHRKEKSKSSKAQTTPAGHQKAPKNAVRTPDYTVFSSAWSNAKA